MKREHTFLAKPRCKHHPLRDVHSRGVCASDYNRFAAKVRAGDVTWEHLERIGACDPKERTIDDLIQQLESRAGLDSRQPAAV